MARPWAVEDLSLIGEVAERTRMASERLRGEMSKVLDNLLRANVSLQTIIDQAGGNLSSVEGALAQRVPVAVE